MVFTALGVSKSLARAAFTAFWVLASLGWEMGVNYDDETGKVLPGAPAWHQPWIHKYPFLRSKKISTQGPFLGCVYGFVNRIPVATLAK